MDTISRENNSMLPVGAIILGAIALLLGGYAAVTVMKVNRTLTEHETKIGKIDGIENTANSAATTASGAASSADRATREVQKLAKETQAGFDQVGPIIGSLQGSVTKLEDSMKKPGAKGAGKDAEKDKKGAEPAVAGSGEYVVKSGDSGMKIATSHGVTLGDLQAVNPGVNWNSIKPGTKLKMPKK